MKKFVTIVVVLALIFSLSISSFAVEPLSSIGNNMNVVLAYTADLFPASFPTHVTTKQTVYLGNKLSAYRLLDDGTIVPAEYDIYPLIVNDTIIGIVDVIIKNGNVSQVSMGTSFAPQLQSLLSSSNDEFAVLLSDKGVFVKYPMSELVCIKSYTNEAVVVSANSTWNYTSISEMYTVPVTITQQRSTQSNTLDIDPVENTSTTCCPQGLCWAASIAMIANYFNNTSYTALNVHNLCGCLQDDYHSEERAYIRQFGLNASVPDYSFCFADLRECIDANQLLLLDLQRPDVGHNVVAYGYYSLDGSANKIFYYMDPNSGSRTSIFPTSSSDPVEVTTEDGSVYEVHCFIVAYE